MNIQPLKDRVLIKETEAEQVTKSGIIIPDAAKEKPKTGTVVAVGNEAESLKVGDKVLYGKYAGETLDYEGDAYLIMKEVDIFAIIQ